jgi:hypothetical protein
LVFKRIAAASLVVGLLVGGCVADAPGEDTAEAAHAICVPAVAPPFTDRLCVADVDCGNDGACYDRRCFQGACKAFVFAAGQPCDACGTAGMCNSVGACGTLVAPGE